jgi:hypothetical protein
VDIRVTNDAKFEETNCKDGILKKGIGAVTSWRDRNFYILAMQCG